MYSTLRRQYWWKGMRSDVRHHCRSWLTCATRKGTGRPSRPPLKPIEVGGPFHQVGVDVLQLPLTENGNSPRLSDQKSSADMAPQSIYFQIVAQISYQISYKKFVVG